MQDDVHYLSKSFLAILSSSAANNQAFLGPSVSLNMRQVWNLAFVQPIILWPVCPMFSQVCAFGGQSVLGHYSGPAAAGHIQSD